MHRDGYACLVEGRLQPQPKDDYSQDCAPQLLACRSDADCAAATSKWGWGYYCNTHPRVFPNKGSQTDWGKCYLTASTRSSL